MFTNKNHQNKFSGVVGTINAYANGRLIVVMAGLFSLTACSLQSDYVAPVATTPIQWSIQAHDTSDSSSLGYSWWVALHDPAIDALVNATYANNPTLDKALARIDEARAQTGMARADYFPKITASGNISKANTDISGGTGVAGSGAAMGLIAGNSRTRSIGPLLSWELDLWGRIRSSTNASERRLDARTADAENTKLSLAMQVVNTVINWRACSHSAQIDADEITSRQKTLELVQKKIAAGFTADVDAASVTRDLEAAKSSLAAQQELCTRNINALVELSGHDRDMVATILTKPPAIENENSALFMPTPPPATAQLPATVLLTHPSVVAADRDAAAAWADTGVARADRLPQINLSAVLSYEWIRAAGSTLSLASWSLGPDIAATLFDAGKGASNLDAAKARYAQAAANLQATVRSIVKEVENALAAEESAVKRIESTQRSLAAAKIAFTAKEAQWKIGMANLLELEDARRQYATAQDSAITAVRDRAIAWVALVNATANSITLTQSKPHEPVSIPQH